MKTLLLTLISFAIAGAQTLTFTFSDAAGYADIGQAHMLITGNATGNQACYLIYQADGNKIGIVTDAGSDPTAYQTIGLGIPLSNSQCSLNLASTAVTHAGNILTITNTYTFPASWAGAKTIMMNSYSTANVASGWVTVGALTVPSATPPLSVSVVQGVPGPQGLPGETGETGATGPQGPPGTATSGNAAGLLAGRPSLCTIGDFYIALDQPRGQQIYLCDQLGWYQMGTTGGSGALLMTAGTLDINPVVLARLAAANVFTGLTTAANGLSLASQIPEPVCSTPYRGTLWYLSQGSDKDSLQACVFTGSQYSWVSLY